MFDRHAIPLLAAGIMIIGWVPSASAQTIPREGHPRRARALTLTAEAPAVWISEDTVWTPPGSISPLTICARQICHRVVAQAQCEEPECPGPGDLFTASASLGPIDNFPDEAEPFGEELRQMRADPILTLVSSHFGTHPDSRPEPAEDWKLRPSVSAGSSVASNGDAQLYWGLSGSIGIAFLLDTQRILGDEWSSGFFDTLVGDRFTIELRGHIWDDGGYENFGVPTYALGVGLMAENDLRHVSRFQAPSLVGLLLPELGLFSRGGNSSF